VLQPPSKLTARAQAEWNRFVAIDLRECDLSVLALLCEQISQADHWQTAFGETKDVQLQQKLAMRIRDCVIQVKALRAELNLTPDAKTTGAKKTDDLDSFLQET
jgi:phage terminase small subunit